MERAYGNMHTDKAWMPEVSQMSIISFILLIAAVDYIYNRELTILPRIFGRRRKDGSRRGESRDEAVRDRIRQARSGRGIRQVQETEPTSSEPAGQRSYVPTGDGHWALRGNSDEARFEHAILANWKRGDVAEMLRMTTSELGKRSLASRLGRAQGCLPAIYEWLCSIAWFYLSDEPYAVIRSMNLTMDSRWLPVTCAGAGQGDIVIEYPDKTVLIEASLMNLNNQRRNEWEPAMRHTAEVASKRDVPVYTLFVAPRLDENTINVWRAVSRVPMRAQNGREVRCRILPVTSDELSQWLERRVPMSRILEGIDQAYAEDSQADFDRSWRNDFVTSM